jgi:hypothetical protein
MALKSKRGKKTSKKIGTGIWILLLKIDKIKEA